jgi:hypothetical protein
LYCRWPPGTRFSYSNPGFIVVTYLIEKFSGHTYNTYVADNLFNPLDMTRTNVDLVLEGPEYAKGYKYEKGAYENVPLYAIYAALAGALNSCADDMARFVRFYLHDGMSDSVSLFTPTELDKMESPETTLAAAAGLQTGYGYANYWTHLNKKSPFHGHDGGIDGFVSKYAYNRQLGVGYAISNNGSTGFGDKIPSWIVDYLTQSTPEPMRKTKPIEEKTRKAFTGYYRYHSSRNELFAPIEFLIKGRHLRVENDTLYLSKFLGKDEAWVHAGNHLFRKTDHVIPSLVLLNNADGTNVVAGMRTGYLEHTGFTWLAILRTILIAGLLFNVIMIPSGVIISILQLFGKVDRYISRLLTMPFLSSASLLALFVFFMNSLGDLASLGTVNYYTIGVYAAGLLFAALTLIAFIRIFREYSTNRFKILTVAMLSFSIMQCVMLGFLVWGHYIGLKLWL